MSGPTDDRARILARRARFVAAALATLTPGAARGQPDETPDCEVDPEACRPSVCLSDDVIEGELTPPKAKAEPQSAPAPRPQICLSVIDDTADRPLRHDGFYLRLAAGGGFLGVKGGGVDHRGPALSLSLDFGPTVFPGLATGIGLALVHSPVASTTPGDETVTATSFLGGPFFDYFPNPEAGLHLGGRFAPAITSAGDSGARPGAGASAFVGWDGFVADDWSLGALLTGGAAFGVGRSETLVARTLSLELSLLWH
ncbi:MAG: hypothetical protein KC776_38295 [Myxococcales bacterium]|nr:hypothetical protein [Myxococcales bacterium]MCB9576275.1 hypothetical protein [Polyangiaceae bacterium]